MTGLIELSLLALVAYLIGCVAGHRARRLNVRFASPTLAIAAPAAEEPPRPPVEVAPEPFVIETAMPARPRRANVRIIVPLPPLESPTEPPSPAPRDGGADDLKQINGIGGKLESKLNAAGIFRFAQIAALTKREAARLDKELALGGRIERDEWVKQAKLLKKSTAKRPGRSAGP